MSCARMNLFIRSFVDAAVVAAAIAASQWLVVSARSPRFFSQFNFRVIISFNFKYKHYSWQMWYPFTFATHSWTHITKSLLYKRHIGGTASTVAVRMCSLRIRALHTFRQFISRRIYTLTVATHICHIVITIIMGMHLFSTQFKHPHENVIIMP